jgi:serine protease
MMMRSQTKWLLVLWLVACGSAKAATLEAIEYYNAALDHYFVTSFADEITKLDAGFFAGWPRTGQHFTVFDPTTPVAGASPVCRFYGVPAAGLDSHFYSASPAECADVLRRFAGAWIEETDNAFGIYLPDPVSGQCPQGSVPVYRAWNNRADSNHRFTTDPATLQAMVAKGYIAEGYGPASMPVAMCSPGGPGTGQSVPACVVTTSNASPLAGSTVTLSASCTNAPTAYTWTNCMSATSQCNATSASVGQVTYTVVARNAAGASAPASVAVSWSTVSSSAPKCTMARTSQTDPPTVGTFAAFEVTCNAVVGAYTWQGCKSSTRTCVVRESAPGPHTYTVFALGTGGSSEPVSVTLNWVASAPTPPGLCSAFPSYLYSDLGSQTARIESVLMPVPPAFAWNGAWTVRFSVPVGSTGGNMSSAEFAGQPTFREVTLSRTPCDFRPTDTTGANGPVARQSGLSNVIQFTTTFHPGFTVLTPGATYYYSVRNFQPSTGTISCPSSPGRCDAFVESVLPTH